MLANIKKAALALAFASLSTGAVAQVYQWSFTSTDTSQVFAFLDYDTVTNDFRLYDNAANNYLNDVNPSSIGVNGVAFSFGSPVVFPATVNTFQTVYDTPNANRVMPSFASVASPVSGLDYELISASNRRTDEIGDGESTSFDLGIALPNDPTTWTVALRLNTNNANAANYLGNGSWIEQSSVAAIPEADTSAMMVLGLGVLGFVARRRKQA